MVSPSVLVAWVCSHDHPAQPLHRLRFRARDERERIQREAIAWIRVFLRHVIASTPDSSRDVPRPPPPQNSTSHLVDEEEEAHLRAMIDAWTSDPTQTLRRLVSVLAVDVDAPSFFVSSASSGASVGSESSSRRGGRGGKKSGKSSKPSSEEEGRSLAHATVPWAHIAELVDEVVCVHPGHVANPMQRDKLHEIVLALLPVVSQIVPRLGILAVPSLARMLRSVVRALSVWCGILATDDDFRSSTLRVISTILRLTGVTLLRIGSSCPFRFFRVIVDIVVQSFRRASSIPALVDSGIVSLFCKVFSVCVQVRPKMIHRLPLVFLLRVKTSDHFNGDLFRARCHLVDVVSQYVGSSDSESLIRFLNIRDDSFGWMTRFPSLLRSRFSSSVPRSSRSSFFRFATNAESYDRASSSLLSEMDTVIVASRKSEDRALQTSPTLFVQPTSVEKRVDFKSLDELSEDYVRSVQSSEMKEVISPPPSVGSSSPVRKRNVSDREFDDRAIFLQTEEKGGSEEESLIPVQKRLHSNPSTIEDPSLHRHLSESSSHQLDGLNASLSMMIDSDIPPAAPYTSASALMTTKDVTSQNSDDEDEFTLLVDAPPDEDDVEEGLDHVIDDYGK